MVFNENGKNLSLRKIKQFKEFFFPTMVVHLERIIENKPDNYEMFTKKLDSVIYAYTGDEDVFLFGQPKARNKKIKSCKSLALKLCNMHREEILIQLAKIQGISDKVTCAKFLKRNVKLLRDELISNLFCLMTIEIIHKKNPSFFSLNKKKIVQISDAVQPEDQKKNTN